MYQYTLVTISPLANYTKQELLTKFPDSQIVNSQADFIEFATLCEIDEFRALHSATYIKSSRLTRNLYRRDWRVAYVPAGINPALAYIMCQIGEVKKTDTVLDPFCGGGTIPISASLYFHNKMTIASDLSGKAIDVTKQNIAAAHLTAKQIVCFRSSIDGLKIQESFVDKIITNLPFGVRVGKHDTNIDIYQSFANQAERIVKPGGLVVVLTQEKRLLEEVFYKKDFELKSRINIKQGGLAPTIFVYERLSS